MCVWGGEGVHNGASAVVVILVLHSAEPLES